MKDGHIFTAKFAGQCCECEQFFDSGTKVEAVETLSAFFRYKHAVPQECVETVHLPGDKPTKFEGTTLDEMGY